MNVYLPAVLRVLELYLGMARRLLVQCGLVDLIFVYGLRSVAFLCFV